MATGIAHEHITLRLQLDDAIGSVLVDKVQIQQVLINLIRNAFEAASEMEKCRRMVFIRTFFSDNDAVEITVTESPYL